jgi:hypothetical protein
VFFFWFWFFFCLLLLLLPDAVVVFSRKGEPKLIYDNKQSASKIQSYCDSPDPYCCTGNDANVHQGYGQVYGQAALTFIKSKLSNSSGGGGGGGGSTTTTTGSGNTPTTSPGNCAAKWGQCGGQG